MTTIYEHPQSLGASVTFTSADTLDVIDPAVVAVTITGPDGSETTLVFGVDPQVERLGTGRYRVVFTADTPGRWLVRWVASGGIDVTVEDEVLVRERRTVGGRFPSVDEIEDYLAREFTAGQRQAASVLVDATVQTLGDWLGQPLWEQDVVESHAGWAVDDDGTLRLDWLPVSVSAVTVDGASADWQPWAGGVNVGYQPDPDAVVVVYYRAGLPDRLAAVVRAVVTETAAALLGPMLNDEHAVRAVSMGGVSVTPGDLVMRVEWRQLLAQHRRPI